MSLTIFPTKIFNSEVDVSLEAFAPSNQMELWHSILSDRKSPSRKNIWPGFKKFDDLSIYMNSCNFFDAFSEEYGYVIRDILGNLVGTFHIFNINWGLHNAEVGYGIHHSHVGKGFATKSLLLSEDVLRNSQFETLNIICENWNKDSWRIAEKCGYSLLETSHESFACPGCDDCNRKYIKYLVSLPSRVSS